MAQELSVSLGETIHSHGLRLLDEPKTAPVTEGGAQCRRTDPEAPVRHIMGWSRGVTEQFEGPGEGMLLSTTEALGAVPEAYVTVEFFEKEPGWIAVQFRMEDEEGFVHHVCTHDKRGKWGHTWVNTANTNTWQKAVIRLTKPVLSSNAEGDIKLVSDAPLFVRSVAISTERPADADALGLMGHASRVYDVLAAQYPRASVPVSLGNIGAIFEDRNGRSDIKSQQDVAPWVPAYKGLGITSIQSYVRWASIEREENVWDWSFYDWVVDLTRQFDMKWVAFIMIGPHYAMPQWWLDAGNDYRNKCVEHGEESWVQSIWSPVMLDYVDRFMKTFAGHYPEEAIESIMLGPAGDFGETTTNGVFIAHDYHTHVGHWCAEDVAVADFRAKMEEKYGVIKELNDHWGSAYSSFDELKPVLREDAPSVRAWVDQMNWYVDRMTWWTQRWGEITSAALPETIIYMAAGGAGDPPRAATWSGQMKALAHTGVGARVTNEGGDYAFNFAYTAWAGTCCRFYGLPFGNEPWGGDMCGNGVLGRIFNAATQGANNFWAYDRHYRAIPTWRGLPYSLPLLGGAYVRKNRVAVYYPWTHFVVNDEHGFSEKGLRDIFWPQIEELRDVIDFDLVDDVLIADGIMKDYDFLIVLQGTVYEHDELARIASWVEDGGVLITHNIGIPTTIEGDISMGQKLLDFHTNPKKNEIDLGARVATVGKGCTVMLPICANMKGFHGDERWDRDHKDHPSTKPEFWTMLNAVLANASELEVGLPDQPVIDGDRDEVYAALVEHEGVPGVLFLSQSAEDVVKHIAIPGGATKDVTVPAGELLYVSLG